MFVFVLDKNRKPLDPTHPARARKLLRTGRAKVFRRYPLTIILLDRRIENSQTQQYRLKIDPGAKTTGLAIVQGSVVVWAAELTHRGFAIRDALTIRRQLRRSRRNRKTRYRAARFDNRRRQSGWLPPSLNSRVENTLTLVRRLMKVCPIAAISQELVRFDLSKMQNPQVSGVLYQQGELAGYEVREYLLTKFEQRCVYCGVTDTHLEIEHVVPRSKGGSNRVSNLTIACDCCNQAKGNLDVKDFLSGKPDVLQRVLAQIKTPLADAAAVNTTRWALFERLKALGLPVETGTGGQTKFNRTHLGLIKTHWTDAVAVGSSTPEQVLIKVNKPVMIKATGYGHRRMCNITKFGFPQVNKKGELVTRSRVKVVYGFQTGDMVRAVPKAKMQALMLVVLRFALLDSLIFPRLLANFRLSTTSTANLFTDRMDTVIPSFPHLSSKSAIRGEAIAPYFYDPSDRLATVFFHKTKRSDPPTEQASTTGHQSTKY